MNTAAIAFQHLRKIYGELVAIDDLCLEIQPREFFGLLGPKGAGKTTSLHTLVGLVKPTVGQVLVKEPDVVRDYRQVRRLVGITFQLQDTPLTIDAIELAALADTVTLRECVGHAETLAESFQLHTETTSELDLDKGR